MKVKDLWRFAEKFESGSDEDCWEWLAGRDKDGYGRFSLHGKTFGAHRLAYEYCVGPIPEGLQIDHLCRNTSCVNPHHLEPVTGKENTNRGIGNRQKEKTHCPRGHEYTGDNLYITPKGQRHCRQCKRRFSKYEGKGGYNRAKTHCPRGHPYSGSNLDLSLEGYRICKQCRRDKRISRYHERKKLDGS